MAMSEKTIKVLNYLKEHDGEQLTAADIAEGVDMPVKSVNGIVTSGLQRKGLSVRTPAVAEIDGEQKTIKLISLTAEGLKFQPGVDDVDKDAE